MQCAMTASTAKLAVQPDMATADDNDDADIGVDAHAEEVSDSWMMERLCPPPALLQPVKYPSLHIFVSFVCMQLLVIVIIHNFMRYSCTVILVKAYPVIIASHTDETIKLVITCA